MKHQLIRLAGLMAMLSASLWAQARVQTVSLSPNQVESATPSQVTLSGKTTLCNPQFSLHTVTAADGSIQLTVMAVNDPVAKCTAGDHDYQTDFNLPALKAGQYEVNVSLEPACRYSTPACMIPTLVEYGGTLYAKDTTTLSFANHPKQAQAGKPFDLLVSNSQYTCANDYTALSTQVDGHGIYVQFTNQVRTGILCMEIFQDWGPTFKMEALPAGVYQIFATASPYCAPGAACPLALMAPQLSGALTVTAGPLSIDSEGKAFSHRMNKSRAGLRIDAKHGVRAVWNGASATLTGIVK